MVTKRVLTGMRPTGPLHLGHYIGALKMWKETQDKNEFECFFMVADIQALTTHADQPELLEKSIKEVTLDYLSVGLDPSLPNTHFVLQSQVPERSELSVLLSMIANMNEVKRNPTLKDELSSQKNPTLGFFAYPVDQVADIQMVQPFPVEKGDKLLVPVGADQVPHLEYARVLARRFNAMYKKEVFLPCEALVGEVGRLVGTDGQAKMSKSKGNTINLTDSKEEVTKKVMAMFTDPKRVSADIPGDTIDNPVFIYLRAFGSDKNKVQEFSDLYEKGKIGDVEVKKYLASILNDFLDPTRERRAKIEGMDLEEILEDGSKKAREICQPIVEAAKEAMHLSYPK